ncbi:S8 family peptidase [Clostridium rectalis]|uniref:S8 family peptidase n=1 Tax=Clostridium rectalis TaxID=2040295 RepID=UPI000F63F70B|nr:S8 family serine peptidase [Clostridium rectalis]
MKKRKILKKSCSFLFAILVFSSLFLVNKVQASKMGSHSEIHLIILFNDDRIDTNVNKFIEKSGGAILNTLSQVGGIEVKCEAKLIPEIKSYNTVKALVPNHNVKIPKERTIKFRESRRSKRSSEYQEGDLYKLYQWDIKKVTNNGKSFELGTGSHDVVIAILDSGIDKNHADLKNNLLGGENFIPKNFNGNKTETGEPEDIEDRLGHGTYISGSIAGNGRIKGVAPDIGFKSYRVFDSNGQTNATIVCSAIIKATDDGANVINLSMAGYDIKGKCYWTDPETGIRYDLGDDMAEYELYKRSIEYAVNHNVSVVTASGNDGLDCTDGELLTEFLNKRDKEDGFEYEGVTCEIPGGIDGVINVSATGRNDIIAEYSNYGDGFIHVSAPGGDYSERESIYDMCLSTGIGNSYMFEEGTSIAAPKVSAIAGLMLSKDKTLTPKEIEKKICEKADKLNGNRLKEFYGAGLVNAYNILNKK